ncbi:MAG: hypothetical protein Q8N23_01325 [Archangium sp.]|nr:hypothetical protein [Archangium sp.]MDP3151278.1 hypothetical protein [Archangium sp.]MDP3569196.1 hypothetical protein [Archangium sp.]
MGALPGGGTAELIITAEGNIAAFPAVAALVKEAVLALPDAHLEGYLPMTQLAGYLSALNVSSRN